MFIRKREYEELKHENTKLKSENNVLRNRLEITQAEKADYKEQLEKEQQENYKQHKQLLAIEKALDLVYGTYNDILKVVNIIRKAIKNEPSISDQTENR